MPILTSTRSGFTGGLPDAKASRQRRSLPPGSAAILLLYCAIAMGSVSDLQPQTPPRGEYEVKAAFLYNFAKFVEWPPTAFAGPDAPLIIGIVGEDPFGKTLDRTVSGKLVQGRPLQVRRWRRAGDVDSCQILYISPSERRALSSLLASLQSLPVLTVGEEEEFIEEGGMIGFRLKGNRVRFDINHLSAQKAGLRISSRLLALASHVWE